MALTEEFEQSGSWLFKRRGYLPIVLLAAGIVVLMLNELNPDRNFLITDIVYLFVSFLGLAIRAFTIGHTPKNTSGRNIKAQKAEVVNTTGIYSIVRHPLYLGNFVIWLGLSIMNGLCLPKNNSLNENLERNMKNGLLKPLPFSRLFLNGLPVIYHFPGKTSLKENIMVLVILFMLLPSLPLLETTILQETGILN